VTQHISQLPDFAMTTPPPMAAPRQAVALEQLQPPAYTLFGAVTFTSTETNGIIGERPPVMTLSDILLQQSASVMDETQRWFWTARWQAGEQEASEDIARSNLTRFDNDNDFLASI